MRKFPINAVSLAILLGAVLAGWWVLRAEGPSGTVRHPNLVLIIIDTLRADRLGCYGYPRDVSPEIDALAAAGTRFSRVVAQCSWTRPSVASFLTSKYPRSLGLLYERTGILPDDAVTLAEVLKKAGYRTLGATANPHLNPVFNFQQGFDKYLDTIHVFNWMDDSLGQIPEGDPSLPPAKELFSSMLDALRGENAALRSEPHYLRFDIMEVHETWGEDDLVRPEFKDLYADVDLPMERRYLQAIRQVSVDIDAFLRELRSLPGWEDALVALVSDHGEGLSSHPHVPIAAGHGYLLYESQISVPMIFLRAGDPRLAARVIDRPVRLLDLMPTVLDLLNVPGPPGMRGTSLVPLLEGGTVSLPEYFVVETHFGGADKLGVYSDKWKLFENRDKHPTLPPISLQPAGVMEDGERTDQAELHPDVVQKLSGFLEDWEKSHPAKEPAPQKRQMSQETIEQLRSLGYLR